MATIGQDNFNDTLPAAPAGYRNVKWQADVAGTNPRNVSAYEPNLGLVDPRTTATETIRDASLGKLVTLSNAGAVAVTLDSAHVPAGFMCWIVNEGVGTATLTPASGTIDGAANLALTTHQGVAAFWDGTNWETNRGVSTSSSGGGLNGVNVQTASYAVVSGDNGKLVVMNSGSAQTITLLNPPPSATWAVFIENIGAGVLTVSRNTLNIDAAAANLTLNQNQGVVIFTDGTNYFTERGMGNAGTVTSVALTMPAEFSVSGSPIVGAGTIAVTKANETANAVYAGPTSGGAAAPTFRALVAADMPSQPFDVVFSPNAVLGSGAIYDVIVFARTVTFPGNFSGAQGHCRINPGTTQTITVNKNGSSIGTISITSGGVFTFTTTGGAAQTFNSGDNMTFNNQSSADTGMVMNVTLAGTR